MWVCEEEVGVGCGLWVWVCVCGGGGGWGGGGGGESTGRKVISLYKVIIQELLIEQYYTIGFEKNAAGFKAVK